MPQFIYTEDLDETFGLKPRSQEHDADRIIEAVHEHDWVTRRIAVGSTVQSHNDVQSLRNCGITHVLDCQTSGLAAFLYKGTGIEFLHCGTEDDGVTKGSEWFHAGMRFGLDALTNKHAKLLVHCFAGVNRGPSMAFAILRALGMSSSQAEHAIRHNRPIVALRYLADANKALEAWKRQKAFLELMRKTAPLEPNVMALPCDDEELGLDDASADRAWDTAIESIRASGRDPDAIIAAGVANVNAWRQMPVK